MNENKNYYKKMLIFSAPIYLVLLSILGGMKLFFSINIDIETLFYTSQILIQCFCCLSILLFFIFSFSYFYALEQVRLCQFYLIRNFFQRNIGKKLMIASCYYGTSFLLFTILARLLFSENNPISLFTLTKDFFGTLIISGILPLFYYFVDVIRLGFPRLFHNQKLCTGLKFIVYITFFYTISTHLGTPLILWTTTISYSLALGFLFLEFLLIGILIAGTWSLYKKSDLPKL